MKNLIFLFALLVIGCGEAEIIEPQEAERLPFDSLSVSYHVEDNILSDFKVTIEGEVTEITLSPITVERSAHDIDFSLVYDKSTYDGNVYYTNDGNGGLDIIITIDGLSYKFESHSFGNRGVGPDKFWFYSSEEKPSVDANGEFEMAYISFYCSFRPFG